MDSFEDRRRSAEKPLILILVKRAAIFLFAICAVSLFYYFVGSASSFLDETLSMLLDVIRVSSLGLIVAAGLGFLLSVSLALFRRHRLGPLGLAGYAFVAAIGSAALGLAQSVSILSHGIR
jgi:hypothetical protein